MLEKRNILCISNPLWEGDYAKTIVELMSVFSTRNNVLYVDNAYTIKDFLQAIYKKKPIGFKRVLGLQDRLRKITLNEGGQVYVLTPPVILTINFLKQGFLYNSLLKFNGWFITRSIKKALRRLNMSDQLLNVVAFNPSLGVVCGRKFNEKTLIYHCYDEIEAAHWLKKHGARLEKEFMKMADAVIVTSEGLYEKKSKIASRCYLIKNAVNVELFKQAFKDEPDKSKLIVGYIGSIDDRLDYGLLEFVINSLPQALFVFVGRINYKHGESILRKYKNVILHGPKGVKDLPGFIKTFSAGIIPFAKNEFTSGIYPLKINEYLAGGIPVISTDFGHLNEFTEVIAIADNKEIFKELLLNEIENDNTEKRKRRLSVAEQNSWKARVEEFSEVVNLLEQAG